jgi:hypothetical protein
MGGHGPAVAGVEAPGMTNVIARQSSQHIGSLASFHDRIIMAESSQWNHHDESGASAGR